MAFYVFWVFITTSDSTDRQTLGINEGKSRLSMSTVGKKSKIDVQEKIKCQL